MVYELRNNKDRIPFLREIPTKYDEHPFANQPEKVVELFNDLFDVSSLPEEHIWVIAVDSKLRINGIMEVTVGTVNSSIITPREVFIRCLLCGAVACILIHNHPSHDPTPSNDDIGVTQRIKEAGEILNVKLTDHIILAGDHYYSFHECGMI